MIIRKVVGNFIVGQFMYGDFYCNIILNMSSIIVLIFIETYEN